MRTDSKTNEKSSQCSLQTQMVASLGAERSDGGSTSGQGGAGQYSVFCRAGELWITDFLLCFQVLASYPVITVRTPGPLHSWVMLDMHIFGSRLTCHLVQMRTEVQTLRSPAVYTFASVTPSFSLPPSLFYHLSISLPLLLPLLSSISGYVKWCEGSAVWAAEWRRASPLSELSFTKELPSSAVLQTSSASSVCETIYEPTSVARHINVPTPSAA